MPFSKSLKELPLVAFLVQEKMQFFIKGFSLPSGAKTKYFYRSLISKLSNVA
jgi:hypothetical protein